MDYIILELLQIQLSEQQPIENNEELQYYVVSMNNNPDFEPKSQLFDFKDKFAIENFISNQKI